jgi:riboflavin biosynthesis pyrimidine reductase
MDKHQAPSVIELFPTSGVERELAGLHLSHDVRTQIDTHSSFVYSGFISSIDGRIGTDGTVGAPPGLGNKRDWRLFQELIVQADVVLVSGRYVRDVGRGVARNIIPDATDGIDGDLVRYRAERGLSPQPAVAIVTRSGGFDVAVASGLSDVVIVAHGAEVSAETLQSWTDAGLDAVLVGEDGDVEVSRLMTALTERGHRVVFSAAGPKVLAMLVPALDALYLTLGAQLLGGQSYMTLLEGDELLPSAGFTVETVYLDPHGPSGTTQLFLEFRRVRRDPVK